MSEVSRLRAFFSPHSTGKTRTARAGTTRTGTPGIAGGPPHPMAAFARGHQRQTAVTTRPPPALPWYSAAVHQTSCTSPPAGVLTPQKRCRGRHSEGWWPPGAGCCGSGAWPAPRAALFRGPGTGRLPPSPDGPTSRYSPKFDQKTTRNKGKNPIHSVE